MLDHNQFIKSYGIILFNDRNEVLMVRRKNSYGYYEFIKKRYSVENLPQIVDEMTNHEKRILMETTLPHNVIFLLKRSKTKWEYPEWGFPKGKRLIYESQLECAFREFEEETGLSRAFIKITNQKISEYFQAPNGKKYCHIYYLAKLRPGINPNLSGYQRSEISVSEWKNKEQAIDCLRPYNDERKKIIENLFKVN
jgi:8-oxo-dGTP pyrophosphatase MutT (NUDIX family)